MFDGFTYQGEEIGMANETVIDFGIKPEELVQPLARMFQYDNYLRDWLASEDCSYEDHASIAASMASVCQMQSVLMRRVLMGWTDDVDTHMDEIHVNGSTLGPVEYWMDEHEGNFASSKHIGAWFDDLSSNPAFSLTFRFTVSQFKRFTDLTRPCRNVAPSVSEVAEADAFVKRMVGHLKTQQVERMESRYRSEIAKIADGNYDALREAFIHLFDARFNERVVVGLCREDAKALQNTLRYEFHQIRTTLHSESGVFSTLYRYYGEKCAITDEVVRDTVLETLSAADGSWRSRVTYDAQKPVAKSIDDAVDFWMSYLGFDDVVTDVSCAVDDDAVDMF